MTTTEGDHAQDDGAAPQLADLLAERERHVRHLRRVRRDFGNWSIGIGKLRIRAVVDTNLIAIVFILWHLLLGTAGAASILFWDDGRELGIALLVGALFSFGSFLAQFWSQAMDYQREFVDKIWLEDDVELLRETLNTLTDLERQIDRRLREPRAPETT